MANQFLVPQFIDVEDKIIGPVTVRQFVIMIVALLIGAIFYKAFRFIVFLPLTVLEVTVAATLSFAKVNGRPVHYFLLNFIQTQKRPKARIWNKAAYVAGVKEISDSGPQRTDIIRIKKPISGSRLQDLSLVINTGGLYVPDEDTFHPVLETMPENNPSVAPEQPSEINNQK